MGLPARVLVAGGVGQVQSVERVELPAQSGARSAGSQVSRVAVSGKRAKTKAATTGGEGGLLPLLVVWAKAGETFEAGTNGLVELNECLRVLAAWHDAE